MHQFLFKKLLVNKENWRKIVLLILFIYTSFAIYISFAADSLIFFPQPATYQDTKDILKLPVTSTEKISAIYLPNPRSTDTFLYIHGNAEDLGDVRPTLEQLQSYGFSVFAYDSRGYGTSNGKPSEQNAYQDADAAYKYLTHQLKISPQQIIVYGRSVGGGAATELAAKYRLGGLILESTFTSAFRVVVPFPLLPFDKFSSLDRIANIDCPILIMHGLADKTIASEHGRALYQAALEPKISLWVADAGHNDFAEVAGERYRQALLSFQKLVSKHQFVTTL